MLNLTNFRVEFSVGGHHFDNPVYTLGNADYAGKVNNTRIRNDLNFKENNLNRMRPNNMLDDSDSMSYEGKTRSFFKVGNGMPDVRTRSLTKYYCTGASSITCSSIFAKNLDADGGNPNLYNSLEDLKIDHVYDEIKQKGRNCSYYI